MSWQDGGCPLLKSRYVVQIHSNSHCRLIHTVSGHIYRCKHVPFPNPGVGDFISRNYRRVAEVWMDEYAEYLYKRRPALRTVDPLDLTKQKAVRERLKCKSFKVFQSHLIFVRYQSYQCFGYSGLWKS